MLTKAISIFSLVFILGMTCSMALALDAALVSGALLHLDAREQTEKDVTWKNRGKAGGEIPATGKPPVLEEGDIKIPALGINEPAKWYTLKESNSTFSGPAGDPIPKLAIEAWTLEILAKRNGEKFLEEHHLVGFQTDPRENVQGIRIRLKDGAGMIDMWTMGKKNGKAVWYDQGELGIDIKKDEWHWMAFVWNNGQSLVIYQDGKQVGKNEAKASTVEFDAKTPIDSISIGANHFDERRRAFNGSFAIVRVYDKALSAVEIMKNIRGTFAVKPANKLAATWGKVKTSF
ncbi:LamG domain-containing protein [Candidatus Poribacteria bacterium]|nr:LamG domain-containing protein [Candidatus Poribacteria bacterium]